jgi:hypothetical protein
MKTHSMYILGILVNAISVALHLGLDLWINTLFVIISGICTISLMNSYYKFLKQK